jgi:hypothetical protein
MPQRPPDSPGDITTAELMSKRARRSRLRRNRLESRELDLDEIVDVRVPSTCNQPLPLAL